MRPAQPAGGWLQAHNVRCWRTAIAPCNDAIRIRRASPGDARAIANVHVATWRDAYRDLLPADFLDALSADVRERWWRSELDVTPAARRPWVADSGGEVVGFVSAGAGRDSDAPAGRGEVYAIYVLPDCWDRGVGRDLLAHAERDLHELGYSDATLWVLAGNDRARRFYEVAGWAPAGTRRDTIGGVEVDEVRYRKSLGSSSTGRS